MIWRQCTNTAIHLAACWAAKRSTLLIDADPNLSASKWHQRGDGSVGGDCVPIQRAPMAMAKPWELLVMDTAGGSRDEQITYAEGSTFVICPCPLAASSIENAGRWMRPEPGADRAWQQVIDLTVEIEALLI